MGAQSVDSRARCVPTAEALCHPTPLTRPATRPGRTCCESTQAETRQFRRTGRWWDAKDEQAARGAVSEPCPGVIERHHLPETDWAYAAA